MHRTLLVVYAVGSSINAWITGRGRSEVSFGWWSQQIGQDRFEPIRPNLISPHGRVQLVQVHHSFKQLSVLVRQPVVHIKESDPGAIGKASQAFVYLANNGHKFEVIVSEEDASQDDCHTRRFILTGFQYRLCPAHDLI